LRVTYLEELVVELASYGVVVLQPLALNVNHYKAPVVLVRRETEANNQCK